MALLAVLSPVSFLLELEVPIREDEKEKKMSAEPEAGFKDPSVMNKKGGELVE